MLRRERVSKGWGRGGGEPLPSDGIMTEQLLGASRPEAVSLSLPRARETAGFAGHVVFMQ